MYIDRNDYIDKNKSSDDPSAVNDYYRWTLSDEPDNHRNNRHNKSVITCLIVLLCIAVLLVVLSVYKGSGAVSLAYETAKDKAISEISDKFYNLGFEKGEQKYHVSNNATLSIEGIKTAAKLEVLEVSDVEFVAVDENDNEGDITAVLEVPGRGVYTVDLAEAEFVVDKERSYVLVRVPKPELGNCKINYGDVKKLTFKNDKFNDSIEVGENLAQEMIGNGYLLIQKEFASNARYYSSAEESAENLIENMVKELNPDVENLQVEVEFVE